MCLREAAKRVGGNKGQATKKQELFFDFVPNPKQNIFYFKVFFGGGGLIALITETQNDV